jgi:hypothetical protein
MIKEMKMTNATKKVVVVAGVVSGAALVASEGSKSGAIRKCLAPKEQGGYGLSRGDTAIFLGLRYQHVRNVAITPVKTPKAAPVVEQPKAEEPKQDEKKAEKAKK